MSEPKEITVKWVGGSSTPNPTVSPHDLFDAGAQLVERLLAAGLDQGIAYDMWEMWLKSAEKIALEAIRHAVPSESTEYYLREVSDE